ncbi:MAG: hypothetical protein JRJ12_08075 [Deltaproteobacteria bacterium]|nr:hypothetical protein [Deltaproteobacteria bacterium]MBW2070709.1 hypothetical protein [Deltaproteobacteria bacterium]
MLQRKEWPKLLALFLFLMVLGAYYDYLSLEMRTWILPLGIFGAATVVIARLKQSEYEMRTAQLLCRSIRTEEIFLVDSKGYNRITISSTPQGAKLVLYDDRQLSRAILEVSEGNPTLELLGEEGKVLVTFTDQGTAALSVRDGANKVIWSAP